MSNSSDKRARVQAEHKEFLWTRIQVTAAAMQAQHDDAVKTWEKYRSDLTDEQNVEVQTQIDVRQAQIKDYLMQGYADYTKAEIK